MSGGFRPIADIAALADSQGVRWADLFNALVSSVWGLLLLTGLGAIASVREQHVPGYPAAGQLLIYLGLPAAFLSLGVLSAFLSRKAGWYHDLYPFAVGLCGLCVFPVLLVSGGGV